jgi:hypothetical protein
MSRPPDQAEGGLEARAVATVAFAALRITQGHPPIRVDLDDTDLGGPAARRI